MAAESPGPRVLFLVLMEVVVTARLALAYCRGYSLIDHRTGKYCEFVFTPYQPGGAAVTR